MAIVGAGWKRTGKTGKNYISFNIEIDGEKKYFIMRHNIGKKLEKQPDYIIYDMELRNKENVSVKQSRDIDQEDDGVF